MKQIVAGSRLAATDHDLRTTRAVTPFRYDDPAIGPHPPRDRDAARTTTDNNGAVLKRERPDEHVSADANAEIGATVALTHHNTFVEAVISTAIHPPGTLPINPNGFVNALSVLEAGGGALLLALLHALLTALKPIRLGLLTLGSLLLALLAALLAVHATLLLKALLPPPFARADFRAGVCTWHLHWRLRHRRSSAHNQRR